jgi:hypothetical protein
MQVSPGVLHVMTPKVLVTELGHDFVQPPPASSAAHA